MSILNSLLYGFSSLLSLEGEAIPTHEEQACCGSKPDGCCKSNGNVEKTCCQGTAANPSCSTNDPTVIEDLKIIYSSVTGTSKLFASELKTRLEAASPAIHIERLSIVDITEYDNDNLLNEGAICVFVLSSYNVEGPLDWFTKWLRDLRYDFRVSRLSLKKLRYAVCGLGDSAYNDDFNVASQNIDKWLGQLGATRIYPLGACDKNADQKEQFDQWTQRFIAELQDKRSLEFAPSQIEYDSGGEDEQEEDGQAGSGDEMVDVEDMGKMVVKLKEAKEARKAEEEQSTESNKITYGNNRSQPVEARAMVSPMLHKNLTKQGYKIVGTHSGVKICRWTKSALRGRGFCYKHAFYGIQSHLCMETTPSLACANKCVFCVAKGTLVATQNGPVPIERLAGLQSIWTAATAADKEEHGLDEGILAGTSIELLSQGERECDELELSNGTKLVCTPDHRIYTQRGWVNAEDLVLNEDLIACWQPSTDKPTFDFDWCTLTKRTSVGCRETYDLSVPKVHSFIANGVVVHNCWRHHTNPVGTTWRWKVDDPQFILDGAMENHYQMIKQLKGVPGVKADRFQEASTIRHCALSLVGEPIFYPHINEFVQLLHQRRISSFLVTNAQFPDKIADMVPITQLYVSVDAGTKESLKKIDRPLFRDFWERFLGSLESLSHKGQRTVYRLTLVKDRNTEEIDNYVELIHRGKPSFIEVKGVTYCGYSGASDLTMANVPYHVEVVEFCKQIVERLGGGYELAAEHAHSCSVLIASTDFKVQGEWHTHIDYEKFFNLVESGQPFTSLDYMAKTPTWALFGSEEAGFNPEETRFYRKQRKAQAQAQSLDQSQTQTEAQVQVQA